MNDSKIAQDEMMFNKLRFSYFTTQNINSPFKNNNKLG